MKKRALENEILAQWQRKKSWKRKFRLDDEEKSRGKGNLGSVMTESSGNIKTLVDFPLEQTPGVNLIWPRPKGLTGCSCLVHGVFFWSFMTKQRQNQFRFSQSSPFLPALGDREGGRSGIPDTSEGLGMKFGTRLPFPPPRNWEKHKSRERKLPQKWRILSLLPWFSHSERSSKNKRSGVAKNRNQSGNRPDPGGDSHQESSEQGGAKGKAGEMQRDEDLAGLEIREFSESRDVDVFLTISAERRGQKLMRVRD